ncbi:hypothetical protein HOY80DRAFT_1134324 [Tuber brumale]|nr:hypothetical protein HOY80DRAFT_1134324 [Tuber brumale]
MPEPAWAPTAIFLLLFYRLKGLPYETIAELISVKVATSYSIKNLRDKAKTCRDDHGLSNPETGRELDRNKTEKFMETLGLSGPLFVVGREFDEEEIMIKR